MSTKTVMHCFRHRAITGHVTLTLFLASWRRRSCILSNRFIATSYYQAEIFWWWNEGCVTKMRQFCTVGAHLTNYKHMHTKTEYFSVVSIQERDPVTLIGCSACGWPAIPLSNNGGGKTGIESMLNPDAIASLSSVMHGLKLWENAQPQSMCRHDLLFCTVPVTRTHVSPIYEIGNLSTFIRII